MSYSNIDLKTIADFCRRKGFVYQGSEIYGGLANTWDYGPLGIMLKNNIKNEWRRHFITERTDMVEIDAGILMNQKVWEASGHVAGFSDCLVDCKSCKSRFRADHLIEAACDIDVEGWTTEQITTTIVDKKITCPKCKATDFTEARYMNLMFETNRDKLNSTLEIIDRLINEESRIKDSLNDYFEKNPEDGKLYIGVPFALSPDDFIINGIKKNYLSLTSEERENKNLIRLQNPDEVKVECFKIGEKERILEQQKQGRIHLRPETAQGIFVNFKNVMQTERRKLPFGIGQVGKAFRNEITPGNFIFRIVELEQMEIEYFIAPPKETSDWNDKFEELLAFQKDFFTKKIGLSGENLRIKEHSPDKLSHYSKRTCDYEYNYSTIGFSELSGLAYRTDFDLSQHSKDFGTYNQSNTNLEYLDPLTNEKFIPHCIEPTVGVDRLFLASICEFYNEEVLENGEIRIVLRFPANLAPYKVAILPLMKKDGLSEKAIELFKKLRLDGISCDYDDAGSIGKRYRRQDENGTPWCACIDYDSMNDNTVTLRNRDTMEQVRVGIDEIKNYLM